VRGRGGINFIYHRHDRNTSHFCSADCSILSSAYCPVSIWYTVYWRCTALFITYELRIHDSRLRSISCIHQSCWYFRPSFVICTLPVPPALPSLWLPPPLLCVKVQYLQTLRVWEGVGVLSNLLETIFCKEFYTLYPIIFKTSKPTKLLLHPTRRS
jgi:hypothetical protein